MTPKTADKTTDVTRPVPRATQLLSFFFIVLYIYLAKNCIHFCNYIMPLLIVLSMHSNKLLFSFYSNRFLYKASIISAVFMSF